MTFTAKDLSAMYLTALWKRQDAKDPAAECTAEQMAEIEQDIADIEWEAEQIGLDLTDTEHTFGAALSLAGDMER